MRSLFVRTFLALACSVGALAACTADIHDNTLTVEDPQVTFTTTANGTSVQAGSSIPVTIKATNVVPVAPDKTPTAEQTGKAVYFKIFLDDTDSAELIVTASLTVNVTIPAATSPGSHKLICKTFSHGGEDQ